MLRACGCMGVCECVLRACGPLKRFLNLTDTSLRRNSFFFVQFFFMHFSQMSFSEMISSQKDGKDEEVETSIKTGTSSINMRHNYNIFWLATKCQPLRPRKQGNSALGERL